MNILRGLNVYQEKLLTNLQLEGNVLYLKELEVIFKDLLPSFSTTEELCIFIRHGGNGMYNLLVDHLEQSNCIYSHFLSPVNIVEQFSWIWYDIKRKTVINNTWILSPSKEVTRKMGVFYKPEKEGCILLIESFCQCAYLKSDDIDNVNCNCEPKIFHNTNPFQSGLKNYYRQIESNRKFSNEANTVPYLQMEREKEYGEDIGPDQKYVEIGIGTVAEERLSGGQC